jgi:hypothetical protein
MLPVFERVQDKAGETPRKRLGISLLLGDVT